MNSTLFARGLFAAGVLSGAIALASCSREASAPPLPPVPLPVASVQPEPSRPTTVVTKAAVMSSASPSLAEKAKAVLNPGADVNMAVAGFQSPQQFLATAYASKNVNIPFMLLKNKVVTQRMSLAASIEALSKYNVNGTLEAARAESEAKADLARKTGPQ